MRLLKLTPQFLRASATYERAGMMEDLSLSPSTVWCVGKSSYEVEEHYCPELARATDAWVRCDRPDGVTAEWHLLHTSNNEDTMIIVIHASANQDAQQMSSNAPGERKKIEPQAVLLVSMAGPLLGWSLNSRAREEDDIASSKLDSDLFMNSEIRPGMKRQ